MEINDDPDATAYDPWGPPVLPEAEVKPCEGLKADLRGQGGETEHGRRVRPYAGSTRPPHVDPAVRKGVYIAKDRKVDS